MCRVMQQVRCAWVWTDWGPWPPAPASRWRLPPRDSPARGFPPAGRPHGWPHREAPRGTVGRGHGEERSLLCFMVSNGSGSWPLDGATRQTAQPAVSGRERRGWRRHSLNFLKTVRNAALHTSCAIRLIISGGVGADKLPQFFLVGTGEFADLDSVLVELECGHHAYVARRRSLLVGIDINLFSKKYFRIKHQFYDCYSIIKANIQSYSRHYLDKDDIWVFRRKNVQHWSDSLAWSTPSCSKINNNQFISRGFQYFIKFCFRSD